MKHLQIIGGSLIRSSQCEALCHGQHYTFKTPVELKEKLSDSSWQKGNWSDFRRFSPHAKLFTLATGLALRDSKIEFMPELIVGILSSDDFEHESDQTAYFEDYVEGGRELGRSSLFVHTLPTSAAVDASVCLGLRGPTLYIRNESDIYGELLNTASNIIFGGNADVMIISYHSCDALLCLALTSGGNTHLELSGKMSPESIFEFVRNNPKGRVHENTAHIS